MTSTKRYYWLKLKEDFFRQKEIKKLRRIAGGDTFTIIYLKMLLRSLENDGRLYYEGVEEDFISELALDIDEEDDNVKMTVSYLMANGILVQNNSEEYEMLTAKEMTGSECEYARRVRKFRAQNAQKELQSNAQPLLSNVTVTKGNTEKEIDKELRVKSKELNTCAEARTKADPDNSDFWRFAKENSELAEEFHKLTGLTPVKSQFGRWVNDLRDLSEADITVDRMQKTVSYMQSKGLPISAPGSILKTAQWLKARGSVPVTTVQTGVNEYPDMYSRMMALQEAGEL